MARTTHRARITGPVQYVAASGKTSVIPLGPCLVERSDGEQVDVIWGAKGQNCVALEVSDLDTAARSGNLVLLD